MKRLLLTLALCFMCNIVYASQYYLYIRKTSLVVTGREDVLPDAGDILEIVPYTEQYKPSDSEKIHYLVLVTDLTDEEFSLITEREIKGDGIVRFRRRKLDLSQLTQFEQEQIVDKTDLINAIIVKPNMH